MIYWTRCQFIFRDMLAGHQEVNLRKPVVPATEFCFPAWSFYYICMGGKGTSYSANWLHFLVSASWQETNKDTSAPKLKLKGTELLYCIGSFLCLYCKTSQPEMASIFCFPIWNDLFAFFHLGIATLCTMGIGIKYCCVCAQVDCPCLYLIRLKVCTT